MNKENKALNELIKELRRLQAVNQELLQALELASSIIGHPDDEATKFIYKAIAKATRETE